jgi:hypothetical protein
MRTVTRVLIMAVMAASFVQTASAQTADEIIEKYLSALGGRAALSKIKSRHVTGTATFSSPAGDLPGTIEVFNQAPNKSRTLLKLDLSVAGMGTATVDQRFDGESGYVTDTLQGNRDITGNQLENLRNGTFPSPFLNYKERGATAEFVRKEQVGGRDAFVLLLKPKSGSTVQCFIDAESSLLLKTIVVTNMPQLGGDVQQTTELLDYRDQDGIKIPFQVRNTSNVQAYTINLTKVENNVALDSTMFSKPQ